VIGKSRYAVAAALLVSALALAACASTTPVGEGQARLSQPIVSQVPAWAGGEPTGTPTTAPSPTYPNVFDTRPTRQSQTLTNEQQKQTAADLNSLHNLVDARVKAAQAHDEENTAAAVSDTTKGLVGQVDDQTNDRVR
jgi:hypothetical protein